MEIAFTTSIRPFCIFTDYFVVISFLHPECTMASSSSLLITVS